MHRSVIVLDVSIRFFCSPTRSHGGFSVLFAGSQRSFGCQLHMIETSPHHCSFYYMMHIFIYIYIQLSTGKYAKNCIGNNVNMGNWWEHNPRCWELLGGTWTIYERWGITNPWDVTGLDTTMPYEIARTWWMGSKLWECHAVFRQMSERLVMSILVKLPETSQVNLS